MERKFTRAIFPGSFDPMTNGHMDVIKRGRNLFDELIIAVGQSSIKDSLFSQAERVEIIKEAIENMSRVSVEAFDGLMVEYAKKKKADVILRGMRSLTDVHYEFKLAMTNRAVAGLETVFVMTSSEYGFTSSTFIREVAQLGGNISQLVPPSVVKHLEKRLSCLNTQSQTAGKTSPKTQTETPEQTSDKKPNANTSHDE